MSTSPSCYFFVEGGAISQSSGQAFGPVEGEVETKFRITSKFSIGSPAKAISICKGVVLIQPQTGSNTLVNLILRPYKQPYPGLNIKYFIYRGLRRDDFFVNGADDPVIPKVANTTSDLVDKINDDFDSFYSEPLFDTNGNAIPKPTLLGKHIGYDTKTDESTLISDFFFKESVISTNGGTTEENDAFELPLIDGGKSLGFFETGECCLDVVLDYGDYKHDFDNGDFAFDLAYARSAEPIIEPSGTDYEIKLQKEQVNQFVDIAAFYGLYSNEGTVTEYNSGNFLQRQGVVIYNKITSVFATRNNWYIYIQSDRGRSYDFYGNYAIAEGNPNNIKTGIDENSINESVFGTYGWPLLIDNQQQVVTDGLNRFYIQLVTDNNNNASLYGQLCIVENAQENNFCNADNLELPPDDDGHYQNLTRVLALNIKAADDGNNISALSMLVYRGITYKYLAGQIEDANNQLIDFYSQPNFFDDVFDLIKSRPIIKQSNSSKYNKMISERVCVINYYYNKNHQGVAAVRTLVVNDAIETSDNANPELERVTYIAEPVSIMTTVTSLNVNLSNDTQTSIPGVNNIEPSQTYTLPEPYYFDILRFSDGTTPIVGLLLKTNDDSEPTKIILGISKSENESLKLLIVNGMTNPRLFLLDLFDEEEQLISPEDITYQKYIMGVVVEDNEVLKLLMPADDITVYSLDRKYHFSESYSRDMKVVKANNTTSTINQTDNG